MARPRAQREEESIVSIVQFGKQGQREKEKVDVPRPGEPDVSAEEQQQTEVFSVELKRITGRNW